MWAVVQCMRCILLVNASQAALPLSALLGLETSVFVESSTSCMYAMAPFYTALTRPGLGPSLESHSQL